MTQGRATPIECRFADLTDLSAWEKSRLRSREGDYFNSAALLQTYHETLLPLRVIECWRRSELVGGCFGWDRRMGRVRRLQIPPTFAHGLLWVRDAELGPSATESLVRDVALALTPFLAEHFDFIEMEAAPELDGLHWFTEQGWDVTPSETHRFPLGDVEAGWMRLDTERRRNIRRAMDRGYTVEPSGEVEALVLGMTEMLDRRGMSHPPLTPFLKRLVRESHESKTGQLLVCRSAEGEMVGAVLAVWSGKKSSLYVGASLTAHRNRGVMALLFWQAIVWLSEQRRWEWADFYGGGLASIISHKKQFNAPVAWATGLRLIPDPRLRMSHHSRGLWRAVKAWVRRKRLTG